MLPETAVKTVYRENLNLANEGSRLSVRIKEHNMKVEKMRLDDLMKKNQHEREQQARESEIRKITLETEKLRLQSEEGGKVRQHEERMKRQEHDKEMARFQMEESLKVREHELRLGREKQEEMKLELSLRREAPEALVLKLEIAKATEKIEKQNLIKLRLQVADDRHARTHSERMAAFEVEKLNSAEEIRQQRLDERRTVTTEMQPEINELNNRCETLEGQRRQKDKDDTRSLRNLGLAATGVGAASGAIGGALGATAAFGLAAGVAGAATVLAPVAGTVAIVSGVGYVYKKAMTCNRA